MPQDGAVYEDMSVAVPETAPVYVQPEAPDSPAAIVADIYANLAGAEPPAASTATPPEAGGLPYNPESELQSMRNNILREQQPGESAPAGQNAAGQPPVIQMPDALKKYTV
jgi:hypothetical protein